MKHLQQTTPIHRVVAFIAYCKTVFGSYSLCTLFGMALLLANSWYSAVQDWTKRHDFAKTYVGISNYFVPNDTQGYYLNQNGTASTFNREEYMATAIDIGATHFWGFADLYVSINTTQLKFQDEKITNNFDFGTFTGLRIYPWALHSNKVRPFMGYKFSPFRYLQKNTNQEQFRYTKVKSVYDFGIGFQWNNLYATAAYNFTPNTSFSSYISKQQSVSDTFPKHWFQLAVNYSFETTRTADNPTSKAANTYFATTNKHGLFLALGPSSAFPIKSSSYISNEAAYFDNKPMPNLFPDMALGYHFSKAETVLALSYRPMVQHRKAFGELLSVNRQSVLLEGYKFLLDYLGVAPYIGLGLSRGTLSGNISLTPKPTIKNTEQWATAIVFGWDIRPSVRGDWWLLRTNLRYFPKLQLNYGQNALSFQHLEFNFIQFVWYPQKMKWHKKQAQREL